MKLKTQRCDVFIAHGPAEVELARSIADTFRQNGIEAVADAEISVGDDASDEIWEALTDSKALVVVLSHSEPSPTMFVEIGAAQAWSKPIYGIAPDPSIRLPASLSRARLLPPASIDEIIRDLKRAPQALSTDQRQLLCDVYVRLGAPADQLSVDQTELRKMRQRFNKVAGTSFSDSQLLHELLIMRKRGELPRLGRKQTTSRRKPA